MPIMVDFYCHALRIEVKYSNGVTETMVGLEEDLRAEFDDILKRDPKAEAKVIQCGASIVNSWRGERHNCPKCGTPMSEFGMKNNAQNWKWNDMGFDRMKHYD